MSSKTPKLIPSLIFILCGLLTAVAQIQPAQVPPSSDQPQSASERAAEIANAVAKVKSGEFNGYHVELVAEGKVTDAIPDLEKQFKLVSDPLDKAKIAQVLLFLGDRKDVYWNYLADLVKPALESDAPDPVQHDAQGREIPGVSPQFAAWMQAHGKSPGEAVEKEIYIQPGIVMLLGGTGDSRAVSLLRRAFSSPNSLIQNAAAMGLAELHDITSVPMIIARCKKAPPETARLIAQSLVYFDDAEAQKTVDAYVPKEKARALRERKAEGKGPLNGR